MMTKCCKTCEHLFNHNSPKYSCEIHDYENGFHKEWDITKDFCSKWEQEESKADKLNEELKHYYYKVCKDVTCENISQASIEFFKQRIEESLERAIDSFVNPEATNKVKEAFDWIL